MKKIISIVLSVVMAMGVNAEVRTLIIQVFDGTNISPALTLTENTDGSSVESQSQVENANFTPLVAISSGTTMYSTYTRHSLTNSALTIKTGTATSYFLLFNGTNYDGVVIYDTQNDQEVDKSAPYAFTAAANSTISDRFVVFYQAAPAGPSAFGICYRGGKITVDNPEDNAMTVRIFDNATGTQVGSDETVAAHSTQDITPTLTAGELYKVEVYYQGAIYTESDSQQHHRIIRAE